VKDRKARV
jgi:hypothetical protein